MPTTPSREAASPAGFAAIAVALAGLVLAFTPWIERLDNRVLDAHWSALRKFDPRPSARDIVIVGIDEASAAQLPAPQGLWHESLGLALVRIASAQPRAIGLEVALPERAYDAVRPGVDRALMVGLAAARRSAALVATLEIDARTRGARPIHAPFLAVLGEDGLGLGILARDIDGVTRRFALSVPTEEGAFPTFAGRLCRALSKGCADGLLDFANGEPFAYVPFARLLETRDVEVLGKMFHDRIVLLGEVQRYGKRIAVPVNLAGWEAGGGDSPAVVVHALALRTALARSAPRESSRVPVVFLVAAAALLVLVRDPRHGALVGLLAAAGFFVLGTLALRGGVFVPVGGALATLVVAWLGRAAWALGRAFEIRRRG